MSEIDKTIEELEQEVLADLNDPEMKKDSSPAGKGAANEPMKKVDAEEDEVEDLGAPVVKGDEKKNSMLLRKSNKMLLLKVPKKVTR